MADGIEKLIRENRLMAPEAQTVRESFAVISQPECRSGDRPDCATIREYHGAWKRLSETSPALGLKLLSTSQYRWPKKAYHIRTTQKLPEGGEKIPKISQELWNRVMAFRWVLRNLEGGEKRFHFMEETLAQEQEHGYTFVWIAKTNMRGMTTDERELLKTAEESFKPPFPSEKGLRDKVLDLLHIEIELREALSRPVK